MYVFIDICMSYTDCLINIKINNLHFCKLVIFGENETYIHIYLIITFRIIHYKIIEYY